MGNKQKSRIDTSGDADPFGYNPFGSLPVSGLSAPSSNPSAGTAFTPEPPDIPSHKDRVLRVRREKKGRAGKTVTIVYGTDELPSIKAAEILAKLKKALACGGAVEDGCLILQGDQPERVCALLNEQGFRSIRSGG
ncbi:MAG: translation initiation factor [Opitutales bacterium]|nr:translation initiation factor [Opitutales bacterium]